LPGPIISAVAVSNVTSTSAVVNWVTDQPATSLVNWGSTTGYGMASLPDPTLKTIHSVTLSGLTPNSVYDFDVVSANSAGTSSTSPNSTFMTGAPAPPVISGVTASNLTGNSATISWTTDQQTVGQLNYGTTAAYGFSQSATTLAMNQAVTLTGLTPGTTYYYQIIATTSAGTSSTASGYVFTTPSASATPPTVGYVAFWGINNTGITISWSTDVNANTAVAYGTTPALGQIYTNTSASYNSTTNHGVVLTGLTPGTTYYFVAQSTGSNGATGYSKTYSFTTTGTAPPTPSFVLTATPATVMAGTSGTSTVTITPSGGFNSAVTLAASAWPAGITGSFGTNPATSSSIASINVASTVTPGIYSLGVGGTSGGLSGSTSIALTVTAAPNPSFTLTATSASIVAGTSGTSTVTITASGGFSSAVTLAASAWPAGITGSFGTNPATSSSIASINVASTVTPGIYSLGVSGTSGALNAATSIALTVTAVPVGVSSSAVFTGLDTSTQGTWTGTYGGDGLLVANLNPAGPSYADVSFNGDLTYTWAAATSDVRALQSSPGSNTRVASSYYASNSFGIGLNLKDGATHQVALYLLDWDTTSRAETVTISDTATGTILDRQSFSGFHNGVYGVWNIKGAVTITISATAGNAVATAILFGPAGGVAPSFTLSGNAAATTPGSTANSSVTITGAGGFNSPVTLSAVNWPSGITAVFGSNPATGSSTLSINVASNVTPGPYSLSVNGTSGVLSASTSISLTVNPISASGNSANYLGQDTTTVGSWTSKYGAAGYAIANDTNVAASYASLILNSALTYTWASQTTDARALLTSPGASTRIASAFTQYTGQSFSMNISITDRKAHTFSLYLLDWDAGSRNQTITISDPVSGAVLDTRTFSSFQNGVYASWTVTGNVVVKVSPNGYTQPAVSGIFFN
jgi:hypothetical protein